ncbi:adenylate/guanylate cyclase domain-containing protein [Synechococcus sp. BA-124 BA4]|nr:adenylate/guanylate cyclase domain-containing protein [Synechococcus sp. BA-124 BA4]
MATSVKPVKRPPERRQVTVLFCDLVNSTTMAEQLDPEELMELVESYYAICDDIVSSHSGYMAQYLGDGILAYFGYPDASEEAAPNAVRAGLRLRDAIRRLPSPTAEPLRCRIGIATGSVVATSIRDIETPHKAGLMMGKTPNLAARLQSEAGPDQILVSESTHRITRELFHHQSLGAKELKGFHQAMPVYAVLEETDVSCRSQARWKTSDLPLIGRQQEMELLLKAWQSASRGQGQLVLLQGEAGIGKSHLVGELKRSLLEQGHRQMSWYCGPNTRESTLHPIAEQIKKTAGFEKGEADGSRQQKLARMMERYGATEASSLEVLADLIGLRGGHQSALDGLTPEKKRQIRLDTLLAMVQAWSDGQPSLIVVEDLHWIDPTTLELLDRLISTAHQHPLMVLATARPEFQAPWPPGDNCAHLHLKRLDRTASELICSCLNPDEALSPQLTRRIVERCDGIPLFVEETTKSMLEQLRANGPSGGDGGDGSDLIPETLHDSLAARLDRLGPARSLASIAAVIGRSFTYELLEAVSSQPEAWLREQMDALLVSGLLQFSEQTAGEAYEFKHALIRDTAYETMLKRDRQTLHEQIARTLSGQFHELVDAEPQLLAHHYTRAGSFEQAIPHWISAGRKSSDMASHEEAVQHFQTALDLLRHEACRREGLPASLELNLLLGLAMSLAGSRSYSAPEVGQILEESRTLAERLEDSQSSFAILRGICNFCIVSCDLDNAERSAGECLQRWDQGRDPIHGIEAHFSIGYVHYVKGSMALARQHLTQSIDLYRLHEGWDLGFPSTHDPMTGSLTALAMVEQACGPPDQVAATLEQARQHAERLGRNYETVYTLSHELLIHVLQGRYLEAIALSDTILGISDAYGYLTWRAIAKVYKGVALAHAGQAEPGGEALSIALEGMREQQRLGVMTLEGFRLAEIATLHSLASSVSEAFATIQAAAEAVRRSGEAYFMPLVHVRQADVIARAQGHDEPAVMEALDQALAIARALGAASFETMINAKKQLYARERIGGSAL